MEVNSINIEWTELFKTISGLKTDVSNRIIIEREVIPIIFVPGIMGSRLVDGKKNKAWDPDDDGFMLKNYGKYDVTAKMRKDLLIGKQFNAKYLQANNEDTEHNKKFADTKDSTRVERGWGGVFWSSYGELLTEFQKYKWKEPIGLCFDFPVFAFGYNWTHTNHKAGEYLAKYIDDIIKVYTKEADAETLKKFGNVSKEKRLCKYVILVSHSMGGLVCRSACKLHGAEEKVLGVFNLPPELRPLIGA